MSEQETPPSVDCLTDAVMAWVTRSYDSHESWKQKAREVFMASNGDSVLSRTRVAGIIRRYFVEQKLKVENVRCWRENYDGVTSVRVEPPKISASDAGYVDWLYVADYLLLPCSAITEEYTEENQRRETEFEQLWSSYELRMAVYDARELIRKHPKMDDERIRDLLKKTRKEASLANVKKARRLEKANLPHIEPIPPERPASLPRYESVYFPSVTRPKQ